jgi:hypothetical protein
MPRPARSTLRIRIAACAAAGVALTAVVAWSINIAMRPAWLKPTLHWDRIGWPFKVPDHWTRAPVPAEASGGPGVTQWFWGVLWIADTRPQRSAPEIHVVDLRITQTGWPWRAVAHETWKERVHLGSTSAPAELRNIGHPTSAWRLGLKFADHRLGICPLWPGFVLDTAFYGALAFLLWSVPGFLRRRARLRRGACPVCAYDLQGTTHGCPECGSAVP